MLQDQEAVFVTEDNKIVKFDAAAKEKIKPFVGHKVNVAGTIKNGVLTIDSITTSVAKPGTGSRLPGAVSRLP